LDCFTGAALKGQFASVWALPEKQARCRRGEAWGGRGCQSDGVPNRDCECGIYAYFTTDRLVGSSHELTAVVTGVVEGTGKTLVGEFGFRTAHAKVLALMVEPVAKPYLFDDNVFVYVIDGQPWGPRLSHQPWVERATADWEVPMFTDRAAMLTAFPLTDLARDFPDLKVGAKS
jgi:hypothetical protein